MSVGRPRVTLASFVWLLPNPLGVYSLGTNLKITQDELPVENSV